MSAPRIEASATAAAGAGKPKERGASGFSARGYGAPSGGSSWRRWMPAVRTLWVAVLVLVVVWLVAVPVAVVVWGSFRDAPPGAGGSYTLQHYQSYASPRLLRAISNTLIFAVASSLLSFVAGCFLAWVTERTNTPFRGFVYAVVLLGFAVPGINTTIAWVLLLNPTVGILNQAVQLVPGVTGPPFDSYGMLPMIWADGIDGITLPFLLMAAALRSMDPSLEEASAAAGAGRLQTFRHVTLPVLAPAVLATLLILFIKNVESFEVPAIMGIPAGVMVFATEVFIATTGFPADQNLAAALAIGYMGLAAVGLAAYYRATNMSEKFATVTGKAFRPARADLGRARWLCFAGTMAVLLVSVLLPFFVMLYGSLLPFYQLPSREVFAAMSFDNYQRVLTNSLTLGALKNNLTVGVLSALAAVILSALIAWVVVRTNIRGRKLLDALSFAPIVVPGLVMGLALGWLYLTVPTPFQMYGTLIVIGLGFVAKYIPYGVRAAHAGLSQVSKELEEASATSGASWLRTLVTITGPLIAGSLLAAFIYILSLTFKVLALPVMLAGPNTELLSVRVFEMYNRGDFTGLNALGVVMFVVLLLLAGLSRALAGRFGYLKTND